MPHHVRSGRRSAPPFVRCSLLLHSHRVPVFQNAPNPEDGHAHSLRSHRNTCSFPAPRTMLRIVLVAVSCTSSDARWLVVLDLVLVHSVTGAARAAVARISPLSWGSVDRCFRHTHVQVNCRWVTYSFNNELRKTHGTFIWWNENSWLSSDLEVHRMRITY